MSKQVIENNSIKSQVKGTVRKKWIAINPDNKKTKSTCLQYLVHKDLSLRESKFYDIMPLIEYLIWQWSYP
jgi:ribosomal protein S20